MQIDASEDFSEGKKILEMKLKQFRAVVLKTSKQTNKPKPLFFFFFGFGTPLKICSSAYCNSAMSLTQGKLQGFPVVPVVSRFAQIAVWAMLCFREEPWMFRRGCGILAQAQPSLPQGLCWEVSLSLHFDVHQWRQWLLNTFLGQADTPLEAAFPSQCSRGSQGAGVTTLGSCSGERSPP